MSSLHTVHVRTCGSTYAVTFDGITPVDVRLTGLYRKATPTRRGFVNGTRRLKLDGLSALVAITEARAQLAASVTLLRELNARPALKHRV